MEIVGGSSKSSRSAALTGVCAGALVVVMGLCAVAARAQDSPPASVKSAADTAAAAEMYEPVAPASSPAAPAAATAGATTRTVVVPDSMLAEVNARQGEGIPPATAVIPSQTSAPDESAENRQVVNYEAQQNPQVVEPQLRSLREFIDEGDETSSLGVELREGQRKLGSGQMASGLLIIEVTPGSPAAKAGLHALNQTTHNILEGAAVAAALVFAPAVLMVPLVDQVKIGESYDMIVGVDGTRVTNYLDFEDRMRDAQPGEIVYLSIVRNGARMQVPVNLPAVLPAQVF